MFSMLLFTQLHTKLFLMRSTALRHTVKGCSAEAKISPTLDTRGPCQGHVLHRLTPSMRARWRDEYTLEFAHLYSPK